MDGSARQQRPLQTARTLLWLQRAGQACDDLVGELPDLRPRAAVPLTAGEITLASPLPAGRSPLAQIFFRKNAPHRILRDLHLPRTPRPDASRQQISFMFA